MVAFRHYPAASGAGIATLGGRVTDDSVMMAASALAMARHSGLK